MSKEKPRFKLHKQGPCPVNGGANVALLFACGKVTSVATPSEQWNWNCPENPRYRIIAYKVVKNAE